MLVLRAISSPGQMVDVVVKPYLPTWTDVYTMLNGSRHFHQPEFLILLGFSQIMPRLSYNSETSCLRLQDRLDSKTCGCVITILWQQLKRLGKGPYLLTL